MQSFAGWHGLADPLKDPERIARSMLKVESVEPVGARSRYLSPAWALLSKRSDARTFFCTDDTVIAVCGTPYWHDSALTELAARDGVANSIQQAYREHGVDLLTRLHGHFSLALLDRTNHALLLATDRMGVHPVYYNHDSTKGIVFGSTATAVQAHPVGRSALNSQAIYDYLYFHVVPAPSCIYLAQRKLLPAQYLYQQQDKLTIKTYWWPIFADRRQQATRHLNDELNATLRNALRRCHPDDKTGAFLSGGVDSSTIAGLLAELGPKPARTFSIGFAATGYDEMDYARAASKHFSTEQHEYYVTPEDVLRLVPRIAESYDEPFGNSSAVPVYYCADLARQNGVTRMLAGDGGDELFGGNERYAKQKVFDAYYRVPAALRHHLIEPLLRGPLGRVPLAPVRKARSYVEQARIPMPYRMQTYNFLQRASAETMLEPDFLRTIDTTGPSALLAEPWEEAQSDNLVDRMLYLDWRFTLADNDLRKVNGMCALAGVEVCYPLLDDEVVELSTQVPASLKVRRLALRYFFKHALRQFLPSSVLTKSKHGFGLPFGVWMKTYAPLQALAYDSLTDLGRRGYLKPSYLAQLVKLHRDEHAAYYGEFIWVLMMLEQWIAAHEASPTM